jgi:hypothetical protein
MNSTSSVWPMRRPRVSSLSRAYGPHGEHQHRQHDQHHDERDAEEDERQNDVASRHQRDEPGEDSHHGRQDEKLDRSCAIFP